MNRLLTLALATCIAASSVSGAFAKTKPGKTTLADFKGNYTGTATLSVPGEAVTGPVSLSFKSNKTGTTGSIALSGTIFTGGTPFPLAANITLAKGSLTIDNFVFNTIAQGYYPGAASYRVSKAKIAYQGVANAEGQSFPFSGTITTTTKGRTQTLTYTALVTIGGGFSYTFTFTVTRKLKKSELAD